ncbi:hypothetical protein BDZ89DRAFT_1069156 [Hymenopellis radicata]|nr:hypothetical protein BDZ89DRAFT_1069156 [Hymenopellis radicata]
MPLDEDEESAYTPITCPNIHQLDATSVLLVNTLTLPRLREASFHPVLATADYALSSFKHLLIRSNCLSALTSLSLTNVSLATSPERVHSILSQTHSLAFLNLEVTMREYDDETDASDRDQIVAIVKSLEVIPTKTVTFLPLLSSLDIQICNHYERFNLRYFGPARWKGDDTVGRARLRTCHFSVQAQHLEDSIYRAAGTERFVFNALIDEGMDLAIRVTSDLTRTFEGNVVFAVPS